MRYLFHVLLLGSFWLALSGHFSMLLVGLGVLSMESRIRRLRI